MRTQTLISLLVQVDSNSSEGSSRRKKKPPKKSIIRKSKVMKEVRFFMSTTHLLIPKLPFCRAVKETLVKICPQHTQMRWQAQALACLQEAAEAYLLSIFTDANLAAIHGKRVTLMPRDIHLVQRLRGPLL